MRNVPSGLSSWSSRDLFPPPLIQKTFSSAESVSPCRLLWKPFGRHPTPHLDQEEPHSFCLSDVSFGRIQPLYEMSTKLLRSSKYLQNQPASIYLPHFLRFSSVTKKKKSLYLPFPRTRHRSSPVFFFKLPLSSQTTSPSVSNRLRGKDFSPFLALPSSKIAHQSKSCYLVRKWFYPISQHKVNIHQTRGSAVNTPVPDSPLR